MSSVRIYCEGVIMDFPEAQTWMKNIIFLHELEVEKLKKAHVDALVSMVKLDKKDPDT
jgi:hypothetical protein